MTKSCPICRPPVPHCFVEIPSATLKSKDFLALFCRIDTLAGHARFPLSSGLQSFQLGGGMIQLAADHGFVAQEFVHVPLTMGRGNVGVLFHPIGAFLK